MDLIEGNIWDKRKKAITVELLKKEMVNFASLNDKGKQKDICDQLQPREELYDDSDTEDAADNDSAPEATLIDANKKKMNLTNCTLLKYQREGLHWLCNREKNVEGKCAGGILADEIPLGCTMHLKCVDFICLSVFEEISVKK